MFKQAPTKTEIDHLLFKRITYRGGYANNELRTGQIINIKEDRFQTSVIILWDEREHIGFGPQGAEPFVQETAQLPSNIVNDNRYTIHE